MKRKYEKAQKKLRITSFIKIVITVLLFIVCLKIDKIPNLIPILLVFLYIFFHVEYFISSYNNKKIYEYLSGTKSYKYKPITITNEELQSMIKEGIPADTYISYNNSIHTIESKNNNCFFLDFNEYKSFKDLMNASIANIKISEIEEFELLSYNGESPKTYKK